MLRKENERFSSNIHSKYVIFERSKVRILFGFGREITNKMYYLNLTVLFSSRHGLKDNRLYDLLRNILTRLNCVFFFFFYEHDIMSNKNLAVESRPALSHANEHEKLREKTTLALLDGF